MSRWSVLLLQVQAVSLICPTDSTTFVHSASRMSSSLLEKRVASSAALESRTLTQSAKIFFNTVRSHGGVRRSENDISSDPQPGHVDNLLLGALNDVFHGLWHGHVENNGGLVTRPRRQLSSLPLVLTCTSQSTAALTHSCHQHIVVCAKTVIDVFATEALHQHISAQNRSAHGREWNVYACCQRSSCGCKHQPSLATTAKTMSESFEVIQRREQRHLLLLHCCRDHFTI